VDIIPGQKFALYGIGGAGWVKNSLSVTAAPNSTWSDTGTSETRTFLDDSANVLGYKVGLGLDVSLTDSLVLGVEGDYEGSQKKSFSLTPQGVEATGQTSVDASVSIFSIGLKLGIKY
jgi:opacity protein-like surface antigen